MLPENKRNCDGSELASQGGFLKAVIKIARYGPMTRRMGKTSGLLNIRLARDPNLIYVYVSLPERH